MKTLRYALIGLLVGLPLVSCAKADECEACSSDDDCRSGLVCSQFDDGLRRCGTGTGATTCFQRAQK